MKSMIVLLGLCILIVGCCNNPEAEEAIAKLEEIDWARFWELAAEKGLFWE